MNFILIEKEARKFQRLVSKGMMHAVQNILGDLLILGKGYERRYLECISALLNRSYTTVEYTAIRH